MTSLAALTVAGCLVVDPAADQILLRDVAPAFANTGALPLDTPIALAPMAGVQRRFDMAELRRLAGRLGLPEPEREVCVERPVTPLDPARILAAMKMHQPAARIELLDYSRQPVPEGVLEFPMSGLRPTQSGAFWGGAIQYGGRHRLSVWARVTVTISAPRVVAAETLSPGKPLDAAALRVETTEEFPSADPLPSAIDEIVGKILRRPVRAGTAIHAAWLDEPKAVSRDETVQVEVREGGALLQFPGQAQSSGAVGQTILVLNPSSNKRFPARVEGVGKVAVGKKPL
jgi:flagella basal body P-ring formation protein FlgA